MPIFRGVQLAQDSLKAPLLDQSRAKRAGAKRLFEAAANAPVPRNDLLPDLVVRLTPVDQIKCAKRRLRKLEDADVQEVANAISTFGFSEPILVGPDHQLVDGESRLLAAMKLGLSHVPCIHLLHMTEDQARAARIAFNRIGAKRVWDIGELKLELVELDAKGQPVVNCGFASIELDQIYAAESAPEKRGKAKAKAEALPLVTQPGDLWELGKHRLYCGDAKLPESYDILLAGDKPQLVLTDPPYNVKISNIVSTQHDEFAEASGEMSDQEFTGFLTAYLMCCYTVIEDGGVVMSFMDNKHIHQLYTANSAAGLEYLNMAIWVKNAAGMGSLYRSQYECVAIFKKPGKHKNTVQLGKNGRDRTNVWFEDGANTGGSEARAMLANHPTPKPPKLLMEAMYDVTDRGHIVLDPFGGSGSTMIAAHRTKRLARLIELSPKYCDVILRRWIDETGIMPVHVASGETFAQRAASTGETEEVPHAR